MTDKIVHILLVIVCMVLCIFSLGMQRFETKTNELEKRVEVLEKNSLKEEN